MKPRTSGTYRYWRDGALQPITEPWRWVQAGDGLRLDGVRMHDDRVLLKVSAGYTPAGCSALRLEWQPGSEKPRAVQYRLAGDILEWKEDGGQLQSGAVPPGTLLFPLLRAATGFLLRQLEGGPREVIVPALHDPDAPTFLHPLPSPRHVTATGDGPEPQRHFRYYGGEYGEAGCDCWLDENDLLLRYRWQSPGGDWDVRLADAAPNSD